MSTVVQVPAGGGSRGLLGGNLAEVGGRSLVRLGVPALKVPSGELTNLGFLRRLGARDLPLLISTGMAHPEEEVADLHAGAVITAADVRRERPPA